MHFPNHLLAMPDSGLKVKLRLGTKHDPLFEVRKHLVEAEELLAELESVGFQGAAGCAAYDDEEEEREKERDGGR